MSMPKEVSKLLPVSPDRYQVSGSDELFSVTVVRGHSEVRVTFVLHSEGVWRAVCRWGGTTRMGNLLSTPEEMARVVESAKSLLKY